MNLVKVDADGKLDVIDPPRKLIQLDVELGERGHHRLVPLGGALGEGGVEVCPQQLVQLLRLQRNSIHDLGAAAIGETRAVGVARKFQDGDGSGTRLLGDLSQFMPWNSNPSYKLVQKGIREEDTHSHASHRPTSRLPPPTYTRTPVPP